MNAYERAIELVEELEDIRETKRWMRVSQEWLDDEDNRLQPDLSEVTVDLYRFWSDRETKTKPLYPKAREIGEKIYHWYKDKYPRRRKITVQRCFEEDDFEQWLQPFREEAGQLADDLEERRQEIDETLIELAPEAVPHIDQDQDELVDIETLSYNRYRSTRYAVRVDLRKYEIERFGIDVEIQYLGPPPHKGFSTRKLCAHCTPQEAEIIKRVPELNDDEFLQWCADYKKRIDPVKYRRHLKRELTVEKADELGLITTNIGYCCIKCGSKPTEWCPESTDGDRHCGAPLCDDCEHGHHCSGRDVYNRVL